MKEFRGCLSLSMATWRRAGTTKAVDVLHTSSGGCLPTRSKMSLRCRWTPSCETCGLAADHGVLGAGLQRAEPRNAILRNSRIRFSTLISPRGIFRRRAIRSRSCWTSTRTITAIRSGSLASRARGRRIFRRVGACRLGRGWARRRLRRPIQAAGTAVTECYRARKRGGKRRRWKI